MISAGQFSDSHKHLLKVLHVQAEILQGIKLGRQREPGESCSTEGGGNRMRKRGRRRRRRRRRERSRSKLVIVVVR